MDTPSSASRRVQRVRHELRRRECVVVSVEPVSPNLVSVTFADDSLADFVSDSFDDHVKIMFNDAQGQPVRRDYTPRHFDRDKRTLTIEFALHGHGLASEWARHAAPGQRMTIGGPRGSMIIPTDFQWHLLAGDATAMPAIRRRLSELPPGTRALVIAQLSDTADRSVLTGSSSVQIQWVSNADELVAALRALTLPDGEGFAWCAGEAAAMAQVRDVLMNDRGLPREVLRVAAYWKRGASEFHENLE